MPEGPEIRRAADRIEQQIGGQVIDDAWFAFPELAEQAASLLGVRVSRVDARGKAMLIWFADQRVLYSHNQLYGVWKLHKEDKPPSTRRSLRVRITTDGRCASLYSASDISLWHEDNLTEHPFLSRLGPDLLSQKVTPLQVQQRMSLKQFHRRSLGALLLDQGFVAGLGNYLRSEILFFAQCHPKQRPVDLTERQRQQLAIFIIDITRQAYQQAGVTNTKAWVENAIAAGEPRRQWRFSVFERAGLSCHRCGRVIERMMVGSRRLYWCPGCQIDTP
ncbi:endonuclease VIII [Halomonas janggokensis]|uniref:DNA-(apurinic or apyrimidinic site) lyase n=1 Tax=Vreelandella janggokensis TaxID=370767 RepID=A0ABT4IS79_9GAMM|nr:endonuclease VIII [Halomonas janggokensis]MCZ0926520.1 endonuclease VIII [Halomonas janggokensis]MCZ0929058.1 endonuclease VIII [Halomonas janggokensis]